MNSLRFTSCHAPNLDATAQAITEYISQHLSLPIEFIDDIDWPERYARLDRGEIDMAWICGLPYVQRVDQAAAKLELLAAPVWRGERYQNRPIYYSDVVVRQASRFQVFDDLRGATWAYNDLGSLSGYAAMRAYLNRLGKETAFFAREVEAGGHLKSLQLILEKRADVAAIDSIVLEQYLSAHPEMGQQMRTITTIGPNPAMPWVVARHVDPTTSAEIRTILLRMHTTSAGQALLAQGPIAHFAPVADQDYNPIRAILHDMIAS